jgi:hypothetical protein
MAKAGSKAKRAEEPDQTPAPAEEGNGADRRSRRGDGDSIMGYFRRIFTASPKLLETRSNAELLQRWLNDHPGETSVPDRVKQGLSNVKSQMRNRLREQKQSRGESRAATAGRPATADVSTSHELEPLEVQIDECLSLAKSIDREGLQDVIHLLRQARNAVVWKIGQ